MNKNATDGHVAYLFGGGHQMTRCVFRQATRRGLVDVVSEQIQQQIQAGLLKPGDRIPSEPELMEQFSVGRSTVREAVKGLASIGILRVKQGEGTFVTEGGRQDSLGFLRSVRADILEVYEVRRMFEVETAGLAALRRTEADLAMMESCLMRQKQGKVWENKDLYVESDIAFHMAVAQAVHNQVLTDIYTEFLPVIKESLQQEINDPAMHMQQADCHEKMLEAIIVRDSEEAQHWARAGLADMVVLLEQLLGKGE